MAEVDAAAPISPDERDWLFKPLEGRRLALCVSGGADSMALLHLIAEWSSSRRVVEKLQSKDGTGAVGAPSPIVVVTVDHGLRPEAEQEAQFVAMQAVRLGLPCWTLTNRGDAGTAAPSGGLQEWARSLRHRLILEAIDSEDASRGAWEGAGGSGQPSDDSRLLVMAHHLNDQAETVLMRLGRGSGIDGLSGMRVRQRLEVARGGRSPLRGEVHRPFLEIGRDRLLSSLRERCAEWIEDPSNADDRFERVRIRKAMSVLGDLGISADSIALSARRLGDARSILELSNRRFLEQSVDWHKGLFGEVALSALPDGAARLVLVRVLEALLRAFGGEARPAGLSQIEDLADTVSSAALEGGGVSGRTLGGCRLDVSSAGGGRLRIFREFGRDGLPEVDLLPGAQVAWDGGRFLLLAGVEAPWTARVGALGAEDWARLKRYLPVLEKLGLPAGPMATMPALRVEGEIVDVPFVSAMLEAGHGFGGFEDGIVRTAWKRAFPAAGHYFRARFVNVAAE